MTPAIDCAKRARIAFTVHEYAHDPAVASYGEEAVQMLGVDPRRVFKTLLVKLDGRQLGVGIVPVCGQLDLKALAAAAGVRKAVMAEVAEAERATGYRVGGISPLGQKRRLPIFLDTSAEGFETVFVSAGRRGLEIELMPVDLASLCQAKIHPIARTVA